MIRNYFDGISISIRDLLIVAFSCGSYLLLSWFLIGFKIDQLVLSSLFAILYLYSQKTRKFILGFSIFIFYWILFDFMKAFPNYKYGNVHIEEIHTLEKFLFGMKSNDVLITPNEFWIQNHHPLLDALSGLFYLLWIPVPLLFAGYLFFKDTDEFLAFSFTFFLINVIGFIIYYVYPVAPPWYLQYNGTAFDPNTPGNPAGLARFDTMFQTNIFSSLYSKSSNVFAAMPSLHAAYPLLVFVYGIRSRLGIMNFLFGTIMTGIWFAAIYSSHHYLVDVIAGILCGVAGIFGFGTLKKSPFFLRVFNVYASFLRLNGAKINQ